MFVLSQWERRVRDCDDKGEERRKEGGRRDWRQMERDWEEVGQDRRSRGQA